MFVVLYRYVVVTVGSTILTFLFIVVTLPVVSVAVYVKVYILPNCNDVVVVTLVFVPFIRMGLFIILVELNKNDVKYTDTEVS